MVQMTTLSEVLNRLKTMGYTEDFNLAVRLTPEDFVIDQHFRFEGNSEDPNDEAVVYAISSDKLGLKGTLVNGYGIYSNPAANELIKALQEKHSLQHPEAGVL